MQRRLLNKVGDTSRHLVDSHREVELDITQDTNVFDSLSSAEKWMSAYGSSFVRIIRSNGLTTKLIAEVKSVANNQYIACRFEIPRTLTNTLSAESTGSTDPVQISFSGRRKIVVDDKRDLLDVDSSGPNVGRDQDSAGERPR